MEQKEEKEDSVRQEDKETYWRWMLSGIKNDIKYIFCFSGIIIFVVVMILASIPGSSRPAWLLGVTIPVLVFLLTYAIWRDIHARKNE